VSDEFLYARNVQNNLNKEMAWAWAGSVPVLSFNEDVPTFI
jgi:hypothetical protein